MAGGGVGEAMLIGAAVGAGTGAVGSAIQDKDIGQGALMGGLMGAATGGIGSQLGGATSTALQNAATPSLEAGLTSAGGDVLANTGTNAAGSMAEQELAAKTIEQGVNQGITDTGTQTAGKEFAMFGGDKAAGNWGQQGLGQGMFPGMTNAQVAGATTAGGISGLASASSQPAPYQAPEQEQYNGPLSQFKMAGPSLSQYNYNPNSFQPSVPPGYAQGGIADLSNPNMYPQSQYQHTAFNMPSQTPISSDVLRSDYDSMPDGYDEVMMARGGIADLGSYSDGGRLLKGPGDGMSDDIPASIAGKQPARLADGEFVVPADVVSHLGNGSTDAGAKTLYGMMDKVRKARTGSKKQGRDINPNKYVPGMADGGIACLAEGGETVEVPQEYQATTYNPQTYNYSEYTQAHRPSGDAPQYYGEIYRGQSPDYSTPGYTLTGGSLGRWNNVAGEAARAAQPASLNQRITQAYLQNTGRAPDSAEVMGAIDRTQQFNEDVYLQNKAAQLKNIGMNQFANYSPQQLKDYIAGKGMTLQEHYNKYGRGEGVSPFSSDLSFISQTPEAQSLGSNVRGATTGDVYNPYTYGIPQLLQTNKPQTVQSRTVQNLIDESLAKYREENPAYTQSSYDPMYQYGG